MYTVQWRVAVHDKCAFETLHDSEGDDPIMCNEAPLSTAYFFSFECTAKQVAVFFVFVGT